MMSLQRETACSTLSALLAGIHVLEPGQERPVSGLTLDSREVVAGSLFCALQGTRRHGLEFAEQVAARGAIAILAEATKEWPPERIEALSSQLGIPVLALPDLARQLSGIAGRFYGEPGADLDAIAVTGTNGKTSVCQFAAQALAHPLPCALVGTLGYGLPGQLQATGHTTPDAIRLQAILAELKAGGAAAVAMEVSSHALDQGRAAGLPVDTAVFTNLTRDHLDYHGDMAGYGRAKQRLFHLPGLRHAVLNADDPFGPELLDSLDPSVQPLLYSLDPRWQPPAGRCQWLRADTLQPRSRGMRVSLSGSWGQGEFEAPLLGDFNVANLLAVLGVILLRDPDLPKALERLQAIRGVPGRMECFGQSGQPLVVVDYAHTPDALEQALRVLRSHRPRRLITLFGCGGERDPGKRPQMGAVAERLSDRVILTDDNPRGEDGGAIIEHIRGGMQEPDAAQVQRNRGRAIRYGVCLAGSEDIVLVAGKGHETTQKMGNLELPFSDRAQVMQTLNEWGQNEREGCQP